MQQLLMMESVLIFRQAACQHSRQVPGNNLKLTRFSHCARNLYETESSTLPPAEEKIRIEGLGFLDLYVPCYKMANIPTLLWPSPPFWRWGRCAGPQRFNERLSGC